MKRKASETGLQDNSSASKKRQSTPRANGHGPSFANAEQITPTKSQKLRDVATAVLSPLKKQLYAPSEPDPHQEDDAAESGSPTPRANVNPFQTPRGTEKKAKQSGVTPSKTKRADRSAKRKSAKVLLDFEDTDDWEGENALAQEILDEDDGVSADGLVEEDVAGGESFSGAEDQSQTPSKRKRGRPKGSKNKRSPTPEGDLPPEERYFFQNRSGPPNVSNNTLASLKLLTHDEYFEQIRQYKDQHDREKRHLMKLHARAFPQWRFELSEGFNICLYGWGSKRQLVTRFAEWLYPKYNYPPTIVVVNGYTPKLNIRSVLSTICTAVMKENAPNCLVGQPMEMLDTILSYMTSHPPSQPLIVIVNSIDATALRRPGTQAILARLVADPNIIMVASADTPTFALMWNTTLRDQFGFVFHDCTTFAPYDVEISVVDDLHELLGRKGRRIGGKEGVGFVLRSLPENARNLYRVLLTELLAIMVDGLDEDATQPQADGEGPNLGTRRVAESPEVGIDHKVLYQKASEEFICSSEMSFRTLLKEFHDHQMIVSRRDASGTEVLGVPLGREEIEGVLEELFLS